tara:strand:- start:108 stop:347 length:240 start_codon:yes stop_codon:yes gene_type:complete
LEVALSGSRASAKSSRERRLPCDGAARQCRDSREVLSVETKAIAQAMQELPNDELRLGILLFDRLHDPSSLLRRSGVHH